MAAEKPMALEEGLRFALREGGLTVGWGLEDVTLRRRCEARASSPSAIRHLFGCLSWRSGHFEKAVLVGGRGRVASRHLRCCSSETRSYK